MRLALLTVVLVLGTLVAVAWAATDDTRLVSRATGAAGAKADATSTLGGISGDGRVIAFDSLATNLDAADLDGTRDVFVRDTQAGTTALVSRAAGAGGAAGNANSFAARISSGGRFVVFNSIATNLHADDPDGLPDVFVRDLQTATVRLASRADGLAGAKDNGGASTPAISANGRFVAFASLGTNLPGDPDTTSDVFVRDLELGTTRLVSRATGAAGVKGNSVSFSPAISADGRLVTFTSAATNLAPGDADATQDVYVRDVQANTTTLVSRASGAGGVKGNAVSTQAQVAAGGRFVIFLSVATNLTPETVGAAGQIFLRDLQTTTTTLVSRASGPAGAPADNGVLASSISADGRLVAFGSVSANLHADDADATSDAFLRDVQAATTTLLSRASGTAGPKGNADSGGPALSGDGRFVAFGSFATNLHPDDGDANPDVFTRELSGVAQPPPSEPTPGPGGTGSAPAAPGPAQAAGLAPVAGRSERLQPVSGVVLVRRRGTRRFVRLRAGSLLPDRSEIDTTRGVVRVVVATTGGRTESALVSKGRAIIDQNRAAPPTTTLKLSAPLACARPGKARAAKRRRHRRRRGLFTQTDGGRFRTRGNHAAATASGTAWLTTDRCTSTRIDVREGVVKVRDLVRRRTIAVRAPRSYTARSR